MKKSYSILCLLIVSCAQHICSSNPNNNLTVPQFIKPLKIAITNEDQEKVAILLQENHGINLTLYGIFTIETNQNIRRALIKYHDEYFQRTKEAHITVKPL